MTEKNLSRATAAEIARNFGRYKELAQRAPVEVTSHGRKSVVLISAGEYARLKALDDRQALYVNELPASMVKALKTAKPPVTSKAFNREMKRR